MLLRSRLYILSLLRSVGREIIQKNKWKKARSAVDHAIPQRVTVRFWREFSDEKSKVTGAFTFESFERKEEKTKAHM
jgi:uncharacterized protein HemY